MSWFKQNKLLLLTLVIVACLPAVFALLLPGFFITDDGDWMVIRFSAFYEALRDGQFPVRFLSRLNHGYGYPVANFLYPGFMYLAVPIKMIGFDFVWSIKILLSISMIGSGVFTFLWLNKIFDRYASILGSLVYVYAPYHLYDLYTRGSVGEVLALMLVPFILWQLERRSILFSSVGIFLMVLSHNSVSLLLLPLLFVYALATRTLTFVKVLAVFFFGIILTAFFTVPAVIELGFTRFSQVSVSDPTEYFADVGLIGYITVAVLVVSVVLYFITSIKKTKLYPRLFTLMVFGAVVSVLLSSSVSEVVWRYLPSEYIQFPFRILSVSLIATAFLTSYIINYFVGVNKNIVIGVIVVLILVSSYRYIIPEERTFYEDTYYSTNEGTTTVQNEYMPIWVQQDPTQRPPQKVEVENGDIAISNIETNSRKTVVNSISSEGGSVLVHTIYYPGWSGFVNGSRVPVQYDNPRGLIEVDVPQGEATVEVVFEENVLRLLSDMLSLSALVFLLLYATGTSIPVRKLFKL